MKRVTKGDVIAKSGYFYTPSEHQKNVERQKAIEDIRNYCKNGRKEKIIVDQEPVGVKA